MADSVTTTFKLSASYSSETFANTTSSSGTITPEAGSDTALVQIQNIDNAAWEAFDLGDIDTTKRFYLCVINKDPTNYVTVKWKTAVTPTYGPDHVLFPGEGMVLPCQAIAAGYPTPGAQFNAAAGNVQICIADVGTPA